jgi:6-pyruvoyltetrahydropterin/6-carboxytetrahydropterin synthase
METIEDFHVVLWRANHSHCSLLHGYSLGFKLVFECDSLDERNWVMDFGGLKELKDWLEDHFDHTIVVSKDDPEIGQFRALEKRGLAKVKVFDNVGSEKFAEEVFKQMTIIIERSKFQKKALNPTVRVKKYLNTMLTQQYMREYNGFNYNSTCSFITSSYIYNEQQQQTEVLVWL